VTDNSCKHCRRGFWSEQMWMRGRNRIGEIRASPGQRTNLNPLFRESRVLCNVPQAMVRSVPSAAGRRVRLHVGPQGKERRHERQPEKGQQQNGKKLTHWLHWNLKLRYLQYHSSLFTDSKKRRDVAGITTICCSGRIVWSRKVSGTSARVTKISPMCRRVSPYGPMHEPNFL
jgi:hypothetical protein